MITFMTFEEMYKHLKNGNVSILNKKLGTNEYPELKWMMEYFVEKEEYEKCEFLKNLKF